MAGKNKRFTHLVIRMGGMRHAVGGPDGEYDDSVPDEDTPRDQQRDIHNEGDEAYDDYRLERGYDDGSTEDEDYREEGLHGRIHSIMREHDDAHGLEHNSHQDCLFCAYSDRDIGREGTAVGGKGTDVATKDWRDGESKSSDDYHSGRTNLVNLGDQEERSDRSEIKGNLLKHGQSTKHPGFAAVSKKIAAKSHLPMKAARAILAHRTRMASAGAKKANPRLRRVPGA